MGSVAGSHRLSCPKTCAIFPDRDWTHTPCIDRWILIHSTTREVVLETFIWLTRFCSHWTIVKAGTLVKTVKGDSEHEPNQRNCGLVFSPRLGSSQWGEVSMIASSPERAQCQNLCSLLGDFVFWNNAALISPVGTSAPISVAGKKWRLHFLLQPTAGSRHTPCLSLQPTAAVKQWERTKEVGEGSTTIFLGHEQFREGPALGLALWMFKPCFSTCSPLIGLVWVFCHWSHKHLSFSWFTEIAEVRTPLFWFRGDWFGDTTAGVAHCKWLILSKTPAQINFEALTCHMTVCSKWQSCCDQWPLSPVVGTARAL